MRLSDSNLELLRQLTAKLPPHTYRPLGGGRIEIGVENGTCFSESLYNIGLVAVARTSMTAGSRRPEHIHNEQEIFVVYHGELVVNGTTYGVGEVCALAPREPHVLHAPIYMECITVTIPASKALPQDEP